MMEIDIPGWRRLILQDLILDVNGVIAMDGKLLPVVHRRIQALKSSLSVQLLSADTHGLVDEIASELGVGATRLRRDRAEPEQKAEVVQSLGSERTVAIGNGANDVAMLRAAALGIAVIGHEGLATSALDASDIVVGSVHEGLDLLLYPMRIVTTLRR